MSVKRYGFRVNDSKLRDREVARYLARKEKQGYSFCETMRTAIDRLIISEKLSEPLPTKTYSINNKMVKV